METLYMQRALELAQRGTAATEPNPRVGAVLVAEGRIIGEGWHRKLGEIHAEAAALRGVRPQDVPLLASSALYVTLEPCNHYGRQPPCTHRIIEAGIKKVAVGCLDPNPRVAGSGLRKLREAGIFVEIAPNPMPYLDLVRHFLVNQAKQRPFVTLKWAETADRKMGSTVARLLISGTPANNMVHYLRAQHAAIAIGRQTAVADDPLLTTRHVPGPNPIRLVLAKTPLPGHLRMLRGGAPVWVCGPATAATTGLEWMLTEPFPDGLESWLSALYNKQEVGSVLVEGGATVLGWFFDTGLWDECVIIQNDSFIAEAGIAAPAIPWPAHPLGVFNLGNCRVLHLRNTPLQKLLEARAKLDGY